ncbi:MAG: cob(I)yrinic acid a,c-diamide adenosyltransferase [Haloferacaceae archaeon]
MKIYTGRGDGGMTDLGDASRVAKTSARIEAYGSVDEANALLGTVRPTGYDDVDETLASVQNHLHIVQADFASPGSDGGAEDGETDGGEEGHGGGPRIREEHVDALESWIDEAQEELDPLGSFVLPGGSDAGATLHHARAVVRRAERRSVGLATDEPINEEAIVYLNRLSDLLFVLARLVNRRDGEPEESPTY